MNIIIKIKDSKISENSEKLKQIFKSLEDGQYLISISQMKEDVTIEDYRKSYFSKVTICSLETGNSKSDLHNMYKSYYNISSTKDLKLEDWKMFLLNFSIWAYDKMDCIV